MDRQHQIIGIVEDKIGPNGVVDDNGTPEGKIAFLHLNRETGRVVPFDYQVFQAQALYRPRPGETESSAEKAYREVLESCDPEVLETVRSGRADMVALLNSPGGSGVITNQINSATRNVQNHQGTVRAYGTNEVSSAATFILAAANQRFLLNNTASVWHGHSLADGSFHREDMERDRRGLVSFFERSASGPGKDAIIAQIQTSETAEARLTGQQLQEVGIANMAFPNVPAMIRHFETENDLRISDFDLPDGTNPVRAFFDKSLQRRLSDIKGPKKDLPVNEIVRGILSRVFYAVPGTMIALRSPENDFGRNTLNYLYDPIENITLGFVFRYLCENGILQAGERPNTYVKQVEAWGDKFTDSPHLRDINQKVQRTWETQQQDYLDSLDITDQNDLQEFLANRLNRLGRELLRFEHSQQDDSLEAAISAVTPSLAFFILDTIGLPLPTGRCPEIRTVLDRLKLFFRGFFINKTDFPEDRIDSSSLHMASEILEALRHSRQNFRIINERRADEER